MVTKLGPLQVRLLERARRSRSRLVMPADYLERRALRRLRVRGLAKEALGLPDVWTVKEAHDGHTAG